MQWLLDPPPLSCWPWTFAFVVVAPMDASDPTGQCVYTNTTYNLLSTLIAQQLSVVPYLTRAELVPVPNAFLEEVLAQLGQLRCNGQPIRPKVRECATGISMLMQHNDSATASQLTYV